MGAGEARSVFKVVMTVGGRGMRSDFWHCFYVIVEVGFVRKLFRIRIGYDFSGCEMMF